MKMTILRNNKVPPIQEKKLLGFLKDRIKTSLLNCSRTVEYNAMALKIGFIGNIKCNNFSENWNSQNASVKA